MSMILDLENIEVFAQELMRRERSAGTVAQYGRNLRRLQEFLPEDKEVNQERLLAWKEDLMMRCTVKTVNCAIAAVNSFLELFDVPQLKLKSLKCQRKIFTEDELTEEEFQALLRQAKKEGDHQTVALLYAMSSTGLRVSEVRFLTVEAAKRRMAVVRLKGKTRQVPLGDWLCGQLLNFAREQRIDSGVIFQGKRGKPLDRRRIWERMKRLCAGAGVAPVKVHPHALRHLFARLFYNMTQDIAKLADLLGHSSIETTRIYVMTSCHEHRAILDKLTGRLSTKKPPHKDGKRSKRT